MKKILVIDDVMENLIAIKETLEDLIQDCLVLTAQSGKEGLRIAGEEQPDTILTDVMMPGMDGFEVCKKLNEDEATKHIPIMIFTGSKTDTESRIKCLEAGADVFLTKPIDTGELTAQINVMFRIKEAEDKLRAEIELLDEKVKERTKELQRANKSLNQDITERKKVEEALKESERQINAIFNDPETFIGILETDGSLKSANISALAFIGKSISDVKGAKFWETPWWSHSPELQKKLISGIREASTGEGVHFEADHIGENNERIFVDFSIRPIKDSHGNINSLIVEGIDITERKQAEESLRESEQKYRLLVENTDDRIAIIDKKGCYTFMNTKGAKTLGGKPEDFIGKQISEVFSKDLEDKNQALFRKIMKTGKSESYEERIHFPDGDRWLAINVQLVKDSSGKIIGTQGISRDITESKKAEKIQDTLYKISNALNTTDKMRDLYSKIREYLGNVIDTKNIYIALYDEKTDMISLPFDVDEKDDYETFPAGKTITKYVIKTGKPLLATKDVVRKLIKKGLIETVGASSEIWLGIPLKIENKVIGVIAVQSYDDPNLYTEKDIEILTFISEEIALAINRKQVEEELRTGRERLKTANSILRHDIANDVIVIKSALDIYRDENDETMLDEIEKRVKKSLISNGKSGT